MFVILGILGLFICLGIGEGRLVVEKKVKMWLIIVCLFIIIIDRLYMYIGKDIRLLSVKFE